MREHNSVYAGIDIGATSVKCILFDKEAKRYSMLNKRLMVTCATAAEEVEKNISSLIADSMALNGYGEAFPAAIGISSAALFNRITGDIINWPNNPLWNGFPLQRHLAARFETKVVMEDDANACTQAEMADRSGKDLHSMAYITISSGIGCGLILNRSLYTGANGWAGELGHIRIPDAAAACVCGKKGCLQAVASGRALYKKAVDINKSQPVPVEIHELEDVVKLAQQQESWAVKLFDEAAVSIAYAIEYMVMLFDLNLFVLGGGVTRAGDVLIQPIQRHVQQLLQPLKRQAFIETSTLGDKGGALGALQLVM